MNTILFKQKFFFGNTQEALNIIGEYSTSDKVQIIGAINVYLITECHPRGIISDFYNKACDLVTVDGRVLVYLSKIFSTNAFPEMIGGPNLWEKILEFGANNNKSFFFWGATDTILEKAKKRITNNYSGILISGMCNGYFENDGERINNTIKEINRLKPDFIYLGMPSPKKEELALRIKSQITRGNIVLIGGAFDYFAGEKKIGNEILSKLCLDWIYRMIQEPIRLGPRYIKSNTKILFIILKSILEGK
jgi:N-acetylglucosaminyldiphosphoundecaprenol N-acetyl-beta-D-mannosaminyltransferase